MSPTGNIVTGSLLPDEPRQVRGHEEADLQAACMEYLAWSLPPDALAHHAPGEGQRSKRAQRELRRSGYVAGWPDIEVIWRGRVFFFELKRPKGGTLTYVQRECHRRLEYCGAPVTVCRSVPEVEQQLRGLGVPLRGHAQ